MFPATNNRVVVPNKKHDNKFRSLLCGCVLRRLGSDVYSHNYHHTTLMLHHRAPVIRHDKCQVPLYKG